jgi:hypothetical protein
VQSAAWRQSACTGTTSAPVDRLGGGAQIILAARSDGDAGTLGGEQMRDAVADALARAANDGAFALKVEIHVFKLSKNACALR